MTWLSQRPARILRPYLLVGALFLAIAQLPAQTGASLRGVVRQTDGRIVDGATVTVTFNDKTTRSARTDAGGAYVFVVPPAAQSVSITIAMLGFSPVTKTVQIPREADGSINTDFQLAPVAQQLATAVVRAQRQRATRSDREGAGVGEPGSIPAAASGLSGDLTGDIAAAMATVPGISITPDPNGGLPVISAFGLSGDQNSLTLNGMNFGAGSIPRDGVTLRVAQSTYDPGRGGFSGVQTILRLPRGGDITAKGVHLTAEDPHLQGTTPTSARLGTQYARQIASGYWSGPLIEDKAFYSTSFQASRRQSDRVSLTSLDAPSLQALGINRDSANRLITTAGALGIPLTNGAVPSNRVLTNASALTRFDWSPGATSRAGNILYLMAGGNFADNAGTRTNASALSSHGGDTRNWSGQLQLTSSRYVKTILNESNASFVATGSNSAPYLLLPDARILVTSSFADGTQGSSTLRAGGNGNSENRSRAWSMQVRHDVSWFTYSGKHNFKVTGDGRLDNDASTQSGNRLGTYSFNSLTDFGVSSPVSYTRTLGVRQAQGQQLIGALGIGDVFRPYPKLRIQYGVRLEGNRFGDAPELNPAIVSAFGRSTDKVPSAFSIAPMAGFTRQYSPHGGGAFTGGIRQYVGTLGSQTVESISRNTGLADAIQQLTCVGAAVPTPRWSDYAASTASIPSACADGTTGTGFSQTAPNVSLFSPDFRAARRWGAAFGWSGRVVNRWVASVASNYSLNLNRRSSFDLNFNPTQRFALASESNRPVFVNPTSIVAGTGAISTLDSRRFSQFTQVSELRSDLRSDAKQLILGISSVGSQRPQGLGISTSYRAFYTFSDSREQQRGFGGTTAGDPTVAQWANTGLPRHTIQLLGSIQIPRWVNIDAFGRFASGRKFTPLVSADINGDGFANDRAFVFNPSTSNAAVAARMQTLLASSPAGARECLKAQLGQIAGRASCKGPWTQSLNMSVTLDQNRFGFGGRGAISLVVTNVLGAIDQLVHGSSNLHSWGTAGTPDATLLNVRGFDAQNRRYTYDVNPSFGSTSASVATGRLPFVVALDVRLRLGPDRDMQELRSFVRARPADGVPLLDAAQIKERMDKDAQNNFEDVAKRANALQLTPVQVQTLNVLAKRFDSYRDSVYTNIATYLVTLKGNYRHPEAKRRWHDSFVNIAHLYVEAGPQVRALLTEEQFASLSPSITAFFDMDELQFRKYMATASFGSLMELITGEGPD
ncbi:MAG: carboxypeptidase-like regulatory domain-containing protein [Gemmatimonadaceae bacterium]